MSAWLDCKVAARHDWAAGLMTLSLDAPIEPFEPGQWVNLALSLSGEPVRRAYSLASAPGQAPEFYLSLVPEGALSPKLFDLVPGDRIQIEKKAYGFFTLRWLPPAEELWLVATGTGLGPFISILRSDEVWQRFRRVIVVHGVREAAHLAYKDEILEHGRSFGEKLSYVPVLSREPDRAGVLHGRVTTALASGELERAAGVPIADHSHLMLCGNPAMIDELTALLEARGMRRHRQRKPGHITTERYW
jgi:ferredoxin--NADP+ reductase